jgi:hypothetical protein
MRGGRHQLAWSVPCGHGWLGGTGEVVVAGPGGAAPFVPY